jgi:hypothetical protein
MYGRGGNENQLSSGRARVYHGAAMAPARSSLVLLSTAIVAAAGLFLIRESLVAPPESQAASPRAVEHAVNEFALAPDGRHIAFSAPDANGIRTLWLRPVAGGSAWPLPGTDDATRPFWSSDSRFIAYFASGGLRTTPVDGGAPRVIAAVSHAAGGAWHGDVILFADGPLYKVAASGGAAEPVTALGDDETAHASPAFLADGRRFLYTAWHAGAEPRVYLGSLESSVRQEVLGNAAGVAVADGYLVYLRDRALHVQPFDLEILIPRGDPFLVSDGAPSSPGGDGVRAFSLSPAGLLAYQRGPAMTADAGRGNIAGPVTLVDWRAPAP